MDVPTRRWMLNADADDDDAGVMIFVISWLLA